MRKKMEDTIPALQKKFDFEDNLIKFIISTYKICCGVLLEPPPRGGSNEKLQHMYMENDEKNLQKYMYQENMKILIDKALGAMCFSFFHFLFMV